LPRSPACSCSLASSSFACDSCNSTDASTRTAGWLASGTPGIPAAGAASHTVASACCGSCRV
jgi:hypothetical protein